MKLFEKTKRGLESVFSPHFLHDVWEEIFLMLDSINWLTFIVWLTLLSFASLWRLKFLSSRFPAWPKKSGQKFAYLKNEKNNIKDEIKKHNFYQGLLF